MSNPVVFFDMEIGGQPAGRIEMTVRLLANTPFPFLGKNTTTLSDLFFFFCDVSKKRKISIGIFSIAFFLLLRRFVYDIARARGVLCAGPTRSRASRPSPRILLTRTIIRLNNDFTAPSGRVPENG